MTWDDAMDQYGSDKPDLRFEMKLVNMCEAIKNSNFKVFKDIVDKGGLVKAINVKGYSAIARRELDSLVEFVGIYGAKGLAWIMVNEDGTIKSPIAKFFSEDELKEILATGKAEPGDLLLFIADQKPAVVAQALGALRLEMAKRRGLIDEKALAFTWVVKFPMFEYSEEEKRWVAVHHPFTAPCDEDVQYLSTDPGRVYAKAYDMVLNGTEIGGGSIRIHRREVQKEVFKAIGLSEEEAKEKFGFLMTAFEFGAPPHALPLDFDQVDICRRVYRSGDSEYFINKKACRLKDIVTLLSDTGLGRGSMSVIGQNKIDEILNSRPEERRAIFEEAAGIAKYRMRKKEAMVKELTRRQWFLMVLRQL